MNTDKIYAEQLANEYAPKDTSKVVALRKLDAKAKLPATIFTYTFWNHYSTHHRCRHVPFHESNRKRNNVYLYFGHYYWYHWISWNGNQLSAL